MGHYEILKARALAGGSGGGSDVQLVDVVGTSITLEKPLKMVDLVVYGGSNDVGVQTKKLAEVPYKKLYRNASLDLFTAPKSGKYTIWVEDVLASETGGYLKWETTSKYGTISEKNSPYYNNIYMQKGDIFRMYAVNSSCTIKRALAYSGEVDESDIGNDFDETVITINESEIKILSFLRATQTINAVKSAYTDSDGTMWKADELHLDGTLIRRISSDHIELTNPTIETVDTTALRALEFKDGMTITNSENAYMRAVYIAKK